MTIIGPYEVISGYRGVAFGPPGAEVRFGIPRAETTNWHKLPTIYPINAHSISPGETLIISGRMG